MRALAGRPAHKSISAALKSRRPSPIMHVSREAQAEALNFYQKVNFEREYAADPPNSPTSRSSKAQTPDILSTQQGNFLQEYVYYNQKTDLVYLGKKSCSSTLAILLRKGIEIPRLAIGNCGRWTVCCPPEHYSFNLLKILHADHRNFYQQKQCPGCKGLEDVCLVMPPKSMFRLQDIGRAEDEQSEVEFEHYTPLSDSELDIEEV